jgi:hypothetical protein
MEFPQREIDKKLRGWCQRKTQSPLRRRVSDPRKTGGTVLDIQPVIASQEVVQIIVEVERLLGFKIDTSRIIKRGGYQTVDEFVTHTLPQLQNRFNKHYAVPQGAAKGTGGVTVHAS